MPMVVREHAVPAQYTAGVVTSAVTTRLLSLSTEPRRSRKDVGSGSRPPPPGFRHHRWSLSASTPGPPSPWRDAGRNKRVSNTKPLAQSLTHKNEGLRGASAASVITARTLRQRHRVPGAALGAGGTAGTRTGSALAVSRVASLWRKSRQAR